MALVQDAVASSRQLVELHRRMDALEQQLIDVQEAIQNCSSEARVETLGQSLQDFKVRHSLTVPMPPHPVPHSSRK